MEQIVLESKRRNETGKMPARKFRSLDFIPGIVYGKKTASFPIVMEASQLDKAIQQGAAHKVVRLQIEGDDSKEERFCVIQEIQRDAFGDDIYHIDFRHISMEEKLRSKVPLVFQGEPAGAKEGGVVDQVLWEVEVEALPIHLPEKLVLDIRPLGINQSFHVRDIQIPEGVVLLQQPEEVVVVIHPPRAEEVVVAAAPEAGATPAVSAQPELISKGKKEEELTEEKQPSK